MTNDEMKTFLTLGWGKFGARIHAAWCKYNDLYFNNTLKPLPIVPTAILPYGHCVAYTRGSRGVANHIMLAAPKQGEVLVADKGVLLHEMIHQHLFETGKDPSHAGKPWCDCIVRLNKQIGRKAIHAAPDKFGKDADRRSFRFKPVCEATGLATSASRTLRAGRTRLASSWGRYRHSPARQCRHLLDVGLRQQLDRTVQQRPTVGGQHVRQKRCFETQNAGLDRRDRSFDPVLQDRVDGDVALFKGHQFVVVVARRGDRISTAPPSGTTPPSRVPRPATKPDDRDE